MSTLHKKKILLISNAACDHGGIGLNLYKGFKDKGYEIDYLSLYPVKGHTEILSVYKRKNFLTKYVANFSWKLCWRIYKKVYSLDPRYAFFNYSDFILPIKPKKIFKRLKSDYDIIIVYFWQFLLTPFTIKDIFERYRSKFFFCMADYAAMSGGCHYFLNCERYKIGCGLCPAWNSKEENDVTRRNVLFRKQAYDRIDPIITGNSHMQKIYESSFLLKDRTYMKTFGILDLNHFRKIDDLGLRVKYGIPEHKKKIIFFGCQSLKDPKKGINLLLDALERYSQRLMPDEKMEVLLLIAGRDIEEITEFLPFDFHNLGFIGYSCLPEIYSISTCFVSPSINDAGPSMVAQSLACGTPVVSFNIGLAMDCIKTGETGYLAEVGNAADLSSGIENILKLDNSQYEKLCKNCLVKANEIFSIDKSIEKFEKYF